MGHLTPDLAFRVLRHLSVRELLRVEPVNSSIMYPTLLPTTLHIGFAEVANYGSSPFHLEVSLSKHNRH